MSEGQKRNMQREQGVLGNNRESWIRLHSFEMVLYIGDNPEGDPTFVLPDEVKESAGDKHIISMRFFSSKVRPVYINLTSQTEEELDTLQTFLNRAIDMARPVCRAMDELATRRYEEEGDDSNTRLYRPAPQFIVRQREKLEHSSGLQGRSARLPDVDGGEGGQPANAVGVGGTGGDVPNEDASRLGTSDNGEEAGGAAVPGQPPGGPEVPS